jgi:hypothetical protein
MTIARPLAAALLLILGGTGAAQQVYKSIDADGNVIYSASPPPDVSPNRVEPVRIDPPPAASEQQAAQQRLQSALSGSDSGSRSGPGSGKRSANGDGAPADAAPVDADAEFIERNRSNRRVSRGAGVGSGADRGRAAGQLPASRTGR